MKLSLLKPRKALNGAFLKIKPNRSEIELFKHNLIQLLERIDDKESEEFHKNLISDFLKKTYYDPNHFINTKGRNDLVIHNGTSAQTSVGVIIEAKKFGNKAEMVTQNNLNAKAFQELVLYFLRERIIDKNLEIKKLIITNIYEWYIFDVSVFEKIFAQNKSLVKQFEDFENGRLSGKTTDIFYSEIAKPFISGVDQEIEFTYFNLRDYEKTVKNKNKEDDNKLIALYKILSPEHLLKLPFLNDSNTLDKGFYSELLYIIGLAETKDGGKRLIERNKEGQRYSGTLLEDTIIQLDSLNKINRLEKAFLYGETNEERLFNVALTLNITWINRVLFLKLLEAQLISYHSDNESYAFLNKSKIKEYDDLNSLFFQVLAKDFPARNEDVKEQYKKIPYLNSSLFEPTELEHQTLFISNLKDDKIIPILSSTILKDEQGKKRTGTLSTLAYLFDFLDSYDFSSEGSEEIQEENKTLINASVLGLIFEKINGYKDGSFFTPGMITMYMCRETLREAVMQKFNEVKGWNVQSFDELYNKIEDRNEANTIVNAIKICDPAVGSGHFLVSALNELIAIKNDLRILQDKHSNRLKEYNIKVENDELVITDEDGRLFEYNPSHQESQRVQETLFREKQMIIENCLFGVDINPNSVKICRLRLWIELLKNAYYKTPTELETLPNIDINIKNGNSLICRFALNSDLKTALKKSKISIDDYKNAVSDYRNADNKEQKWKLEKLIDNIKTDFRAEINRNSKEVVLLNKLRAEYFSKYQTEQLFETKLTKAQLKDKKDLETKVRKIEDFIEDIKSNKIYENAFEWRFEFPEVLDDEGNFIGFDAIIGNPPYIRIQGIREINSKLADIYIANYQSASGSFDIYSLFAEKGLELIKNNGIINYIMPVKWTNASFGSGLREFLLTNNAISKIINFGAFQAFDASTYTGLQWFERQSENLLYYEVNEDYKTLNELEGYLNSLSEDNATLIPLSKLGKGTWTLTEGDVSKIIDKLNLQPRRISDVFEKIFQGLATSKDDVYFLYKCKVENNYVIGFSKQLDREVTIEQGLTKPLLKGEDVHRYEKITTDRVVIFPYKLENGNAELYQEEEIKELFPNGYSYLKECEEILRGREKGRLKNDNFWYRYIYPKNLTLFDNEKLVAPEISLGGNFSYDQKGQYYSTTTIYGYIKNENVLESYKSLMAILNSKLLWWYLVNTGTVLANGYFRFKPNYLKTFPMPNITPEKDYLLETLVNQILDLKQNKPELSTKKLEEQIDEIIFEMYHLTEDDKTIIKSV